MEFFSQHFANDLNDDYATYLAFGLASTFWELPRKETAQKNIIQKCNLIKMENDDGGAVAVA